MTWFWKACWGSVVPVWLYLGTGCSGINAQQSISPASVILPGLMRVEPSAATPEQGALSGFQVAQTP